MTKLPIIVVDVDVYFNLHRKLWSCKSRHSGKVIGHCDTLASFDPIKFVVQPSGRQRVIEQNRKNVHAFARLSTGLVDISKFEFEKSTKDSVFISYNPYFAGYFYRIHDKSPIVEANGIFLTTENGRPVVLAV